jgi:hypothetical protein
VIVTTTATTTTNNNNNSEMGGAYATCGDRKVAYRVLVGILYVKIPLRRPRRGWEGGFKMDLQEVGWRDMDWIALA